MAKRPWSSQRRGLIVVAALVIAAAAAFVLERGGGHPRRGAPPVHTVTTRAHARSRPPVHRVLRIVSISPRDGSSGVPGAGSISIVFSRPLAAGSPLPSLAPSVPGQWQISGRRLTFRAAELFIPLSQVTVSIPGGYRGVRGNGNATLLHSAVDNFTIRDGSTLRLQQLLSLLDYSPLRWTPSGSAIAPGDTAAQLAAMYAPPSGAFAWRENGWPSGLVSLFQPGSDNVFTRGLIMSFQADHELDVNGSVSAGLWNDLLGAVAEGEVNTGGYTYAIGVKSPPQTLTIWHDGTVVLRSAANTGIPQSPTPSGTYPVYARYRRQVMRGKNPDGTSYADPVQYVAYFYDGDAVHYFPRADYGVPQSLGCIELPLSQAARAWPYLAYGTLVSVVN